MKIKRSHRIIAIFLMLNFLQIITPYNLLLANNNGPTAPEAAVFEPVDATDMINLLTGDFTYVLPLIEVPNPEGGYPLALSYHGGIAMGQEASWVGLGWSLNPGSISRHVAGVPDDWKRTRKYSAIYNKGSVTQTYSGGIGIGWANGAFSVGLYASYTSHKSINGENSYRFDVGLTGSAGHSSSPISVSGSIGTNGVGLGATLRGQKNNHYFFGKQYGGQIVSVGLSQSFVNGATTVSVKSFGTEISLDSKNGLNASIPSIGVSLNGSSSTSARINSYAKSINAMIGIPLGPSGYTLNIGFGYRKEKYWLYENEYNIFNGSLYAGDLTGSLSDTPFDSKVAFDAYELIQDYDNSDIRNSNFVSVGYDNYVVSGQGISGSITPHIIEEGVLPLQYRVHEENEVGFLQSDIRYFYPTNNQKFTNQVSSSATSSDIHFYFDNEISSYLRVNSGNWNLPNGGNYTSLFDFQPQNMTLEYQLNKNGELFDGYRPSNSRIKKGTYIETFTNHEINNSPSIVIAPNNFDRTSVDIPPDGIGAYKITSLDGKVYHYTLPVYQKERFSRSASLNNDINEVFFEQQDLEPYATHWLLTAITGPDYIDVNNNNVLDESDYGYWVNFDYGKWSDGFVWRSPVSSYEESDRTKSYDWGRKEVYYLDKIITRTHTALFIKSPREDNWSSEIDLRNGTEALSFEDIHLKRFVSGDDGQVYMLGLFNDFDFFHLINAGNYGLSWVNFFVETHAHRSLKLDKIVLLDNNASSITISKSNTNQSNPINGGRIKIDAKGELHDLNQGLIETQPALIHDVPSWQGEYFGNILDIGDLVNAPNIDYESLKTIYFNHDEDYSLSPNSPNSTALNGGKLTLMGVSQLGKNGTSLMPPYSFNYHNPDIEYDNKAKDDWGYSSLDARAWSLNEIITPTGGKILIDYEEDDFQKEGAISEFFFDTRFDMKFTGSDAGPRYVHFRNQTDNLPGQSINFLDYFQAGQQNRVNVQYIYDPTAGQGSSERVADVDRVCTVWNVFSNEVIFILPQDNMQGDDRSKELCGAENWTFYQRYEGENSVVSRTANWVQEYRPDHCGEVLNGDHRTKIQFYSNKQLINQQGGGLRVSQIAVQDENGNEYTTRYKYNNPDTGLSSGITSYIPSKRSKKVKYLSALPSPGVIYEYVTAEELNSNMQLSSKTIFNFEVMQPMLETSTGFTMGNALSLVRTQDQNNTFTLNNEAAEVKQSKIKLIDNMASIGRLKSQKEYNSTNQLIFSSTNIYEDVSAVNQGMIEETFDCYKKVWYKNKTDKYFLSSSTKTKVPSVLKQTENIGGSFKTIITTDNYDFLTGQITETSAMDSYGNLNKSKTILAYKIPEYGNFNIPFNMASKVDAITNRNMLSQTAANYTLINHKGEWRPLDVGITTWNNNWTYTNSHGVTSTPTNPAHKIWRKHETYIWDGDVDSEGILQGYDLTTDDGFNWTVGTNLQPAPWQSVSEVTKYDHYSMPLEVRDINNNHASTKMTDKDSKILLSCNAAYGESFYTGAEYGNTPGNDFIEQQIWGEDYRTDEKAHTGSYSIKVSPNNSGYVGFLLKGGTYKAGTYKVSIWVHKDNYQNARFKIGADGALEPFNREKTFAGDWVQLNHYFDRDEVQNDNSRGILIATNDGDIYVDDIRLHPVESSMTSYVYNAFDELSYILGPNNLATHYEYDAAGRLIAVYPETVNGPTLTGGFSLSSEYEYNYKRDIDDGNGDDNNTPPITANISAFLTGCGGNQQYPVSPDHRVFIANVGSVNGGDGSYTYAWSFKPQTSSTWSPMNQTGSEVNLSYHTEESTLCNPDVFSVKFRCIIDDGPGGASPVPKISAPVNIQCHCNQE